MCFQHILYLHFSELYNIHVLNSDSVSAFNLHPREETGTHNYIFNAGVCILYLVAYVTFPKFLLYYLFSPKFHQLTTILILIWREIRNYYNFDKFTGNLSKANVNKDHLSLRKWNSWICQNWGFIRTSSLILILVAGTSQIWGLNWTGVFLKRSNANAESDAVIG